MSAVLVDALLGLPKSNVLSVATVGGATGGTITKGSTEAVVSTNTESLVQEEKNREMPKHKKTNPFFILADGRIMI